MKYVEHDFKDEIQDHTLNNERLKVFELLIRQPTWLHKLEGTLGSGEKVFIKYFTQYFKMKNKNIPLMQPQELLLYDYFSMFKQHTHNLKYECVVICLCYHNQMKY
jgi:hypothetical protein